MPRPDRQYRVVLDAPAPEDLAARCSAAWRDLLEVADRLLEHRHLAHSDGDRGLTGFRDGVEIDIQPERPGRPPDGSPGQGSVRRRPPDSPPDDSSDGFTEGERHHDQIV